VLEIARVGVLTLVPTGTSRIGPDRNMVSCVRRRIVQVRLGKSVRLNVNLSHRGQVARQSRVVLGGVAGVALLCACPQILEDAFVTTSGGSPSHAQSGAGGAGGAGDGGGAGGRAEGGDAGVGGSGGGASGAGTLAPDAGPSGVAGSEGREAPATAIAWGGTSDSACPFGAPELLAGFELGAHSAWGPAPEPDAFTLLFSATPDDDEDLFEATRMARGTSFGGAIALSTVNTGAHEGTPFVTANGLSIYFYSQRSGGEGSRDIYVARRPSSTDTFADEELVANVNTAALDHLPRVSADERTLVFTSTRSGGEGGTDLWMATRESSSLDFGTPVPVPGINTPAIEESGQLSLDQLTLIFNSTRSGGLGGRDLWLATRSSADAPFEPPVNLTGLNSSAQERDVVMSDDGQEVFFVSDRGDEALSRLWRAIRRCDP
jgi:hypothetical protein